jgi:hypothetical protein
MNDRKADHGPDWDTAQGGNESLHTRKSGKAEPLPISDFVAHSPDHTYIYRPIGDSWTSTAVTARVMPIEVGGKKLNPSVWLDRNDAVEQRVWAPGEPQIIEDRLVAEGGFFTKAGARVFNTYKPPQIITSISRDIRFWRDHLHALWPDEADHITRWFAHRVQRPGEKINHALVPGGDQGIGKDAVIAPLKHAVGSGISPRFRRRRRWAASTNFDSRWSCASPRAKTLAISTASPFTMAPRH